MTCGKNISRINNHGSLELIIYNYFRRVQEKLGIKETGAARVPRVMIMLHASGVMGFDGAPILSGNCPRVA